MVIQCPWLQLKLRWIITDIKFSYLKLFCKSPLSLVSFSFLWCLISLQFFMSKHCVKIMKWNLCCPLSVQMLRSGRLSRCPSHPQKNLLPDDIVLKFLREHFLVFSLAICNFMHIYAVLCGMPLAEPVHYTTFFSVSGARWPMHICHFIVI